MPNYMIQAAYTSEAWAAMIKNPQDRSEAVRTIIESLGGQLKALYLTFGEYDAVVLVEFPDNTAAAAFAMRAAGAGHVKGMKTTPLLTVEEGLEAMGKATSLDYPVPDRSR